MPNNMRPRSCRTCGIVFDGGPRAWYCPNCRIARFKGRKRKYQTSGAIRPLGSKDHCIVCKKEYMVKSGNQKYCPDCADSAIREIDRRQGLEWYKKNADIYNALRNESRKLQRQAKYLGTDLKKGEKEGQGTN